MRSSENAGAKHRSNALNSNQGRQARPTTHSKVSVSESSCLPPKNFEAATVTVTTTRHAARGGFFRIRSCARPTPRPIRFASSPLHCSIQRRRRALSRGCRGRRRPRTRRPCCARGAIRGPVGKLGRLAQPRRSSYAHLIWIGGAWAEVGAGGKIARTGQGRGQG